MTIKPHDFDIRTIEELREWFHIGKQKWWIFGEKLLTKPKTHNNIKP